MKILIAEDTEDSRIMLEMVITSMGYEVMSSANGLEALRLARTTPPDLIISDIMMPEMDGFELCRKIKADPGLKKIPFIFYTATYTEHQDKELAKALKASRFIIKPMEPRALIAIIQEVLAASRAEKPPVPREAQKDENKIEEMYRHSVSKKLDKKVRELTRERESLKRSNRALRTLSATNQTLIHAVDEQQLLNDICHVIVKTDPYRMVWVGYVEGDDEQRLVPVAKAGHIGGFFEAMPGDCFHLTKKTGNTARR